MTAAPEPARLAALRRYEVLDTPPEEAFDDLTRLASHICGTPMSLVSLIDEHRQWFKSRVGLEATETPRALAFCDHAIRQPDLYIVPDASADPLFSSNPLVTSDPSIRFYAGAPLVTPDGYALGTLCVIDQVPRQLSASQAEALRALGRQVVAQLELRHNLRKMEAAHAELVAIHHAVPAALVVMDRDGYIVKQNDKATALLGVFPADRVQQREYWSQFEITDLSHHPRRRREIAVARAVAGEAIEGEEIIVHRPDGTNLPLLLCATPLRDDTGRPRGAVAAFQDISHLRDLDCLKDEFVSMVSHELRSPLTSIRGSLQLIDTDDGGALGPEQRELIAVALAGCERLVRLTNDILDLSKIHSGKIELHRAPSSVADIVRAASALPMQVPTNRGRLRVDVASELPTLDVDPDRIVQALVNLLSNALKFSPAGGVVTLAARAVDRGVRFDVRDQGAGITAADAAKIFQPFQQLAAGRRVGGTGLGLAITRAIVEQHGGTIAVTSEAGAGTTFTITLPASADETGVPEGSRLS